MCLWLRKGYISSDFAKKGNSNWLRNRIKDTVCRKEALHNYPTIFYYILETFPSLVTISAKHQILRPIGRKNKLWDVKITPDFCS